MVSKDTAAAIGISLTGLAAGVIVAYLVTKPAQSKIPVEAVAILPDGTQTTYAIYQVGQEMKVATTVPSTTNPISVQAFINGVGASVHPWSVAQTGYTYTIDFGPAPNQPGTYAVYTLVTFADGSTAKSNNLTIIIQSGTPPPPSSEKISLSLNPTNLPYIGGTVAFTVSTNAPDGTTIAIKYDSQTLDQKTVLGGSAQGTFSLPANSGSTPQVYNIYALDVATGAKSSTVQVTVAAPAVGTSQLTLNGTGTYQNLGTFADCVTSSCDGSLIKIFITLNATGGTPPYTYKATYGDGEVHTSPPISTPWSDDWADCCLPLTVQCQVTDAAGSVAKTTINAVFGG